MATPPTLTRYSPSFGPGGIYTGVLPDPSGALYLAADVDAALATLEAKWRAMEVSCRYYTGGESCCHVLCAGELAALRDQHKQTEPSR